MIRYITLFLTFFLFSIGYAQNWKQLMDDPSINVYDVVRVAEAHFDTIDKFKKGSGYKKYQRWLNNTEFKYFPDGNRSAVNPYFVGHAFSQFSNSTQSILFNNGWEELGPYYIETVTGHYSVGLGRLESFYIDPNDTMRIYVGSRSGGFWKTTDGGVTWQGGSTDTLLASGVNTIAVSPTNPDSILINVRNAGNGTTHGIYRSIDGGNTWLVTPFNPTNLGWGGLGTNRQIYQVAYHPTIPNKIIIGTNEGLYVSNDNLTTWTQVVPALDFQMIDFHPINSNIIYATTSNDNDVVYYSVNGGTSFTPSGLLSGSGSRLRISTSPNCPNCVYAGSSDGIWKSSNSGLTYTLLSTPGMSNYGAFAVSDVNADVILFGDIDTHISLDEGLSFTQSTFWSQGNANYDQTGTYVHADIRGAKSINGTFWVNTDGMLAKSNNNGTTWTLFEGQSIRENYNLGVSQSNHYRTICGSQDNGTSINTQNTWIEFYGADGMEGIIHPLNDDWMIGSVQYGTRRRTKDGGLTQEGVTPSGQSGYWIAPLVYDPNDQMQVYHFGDSVYLSEDFGSTWTNMGTPGFTGTIQFATIAENNSSTLIASRNANIEKSTDGGVTWQDISSNLPNYSITDIAFDPNDDSTIIVTFGRYQNDNAKVYITDNQGVSWTNITYNLNNMPIRSVVIDHTDDRNIYLGAEIGVYKKAMNATSWTLYNPDLPNMTVRELEVMRGTNTLRAATWGRGLWEYTIDGRADYPAILKTMITDPPTDDTPKFGIDQYVTSIIDYDNSLTSVYLQWSVDTPAFDSVITMSNIAATEWKSTSALPTYPVGTKMYFKVFAVGQSNDTTETYKFMYEVRPFAYCAATGHANNGNLFINNVTVGQVSFQSQNTGYSLTQSPVIDLMLDSTYTISVTANTNWGSNDMAAWLDFNGDAVFDTSEVILFDTNTGGLATSMFTIPNSVVTWDTLRLRIRLSYWGTNPQSCGTTLGEVEDYYVRFLPYCPPNSTSISASSCDTYNWNGNVYSQSGVFDQTYSTAIGCDSIVSLQLTIFERDSIVDAYQECSSFTWINGITYTANNDTSFVLLTNSYGCDSAIYLNLTIHEQDTSIDIRQACSKYTWIDGITYFSDNNLAQFTLTNANGCDSLVNLNLTVYSADSITETHQACFEYTWIDGITYTSSNDTAKVMYVNSNGCDSVIHLDLTINEIDASVTQNGIELTAVSGADTYQWIDCEGGNAPIIGATEVNFTPTQSGQYAVVVMGSGCQDTSACYTVNIVGLNELVNDKVKVFPNPSNGQFVIGFQSVIAESKVRVYSSSGQLVYDQKHVNTDQIKLNLQLANGVYYIIVNANDLNLVQKLNVVN